MLILKISQEAFFISGRNNEEKSGKRNGISESIELYDIKSAEDLQHILKKLLVETIEGVITGELSAKMNMEEA